jgi:hypothetical protein
MTGPAINADDRPIDPTPVHTADLPPTPIRDRNIPATAWIEAPPALLRAGDDIGGPAIVYKRRLGRWLLWRAGPATRADARYVAVDADDLTRHHEYRLHPDGSGSGEGPSGVVHDRFRSWKQDLVATGRHRRAPPAPSGRPGDRATGHRRGPPIGAPTRRPRAPEGRARTSRTGRRDSASQNAISLKPLPLSP